MNALLEKIAAADAADHAAALTSYREILLRSSTPKAGDEKKLREAMASLNKSPADFERDLRIVEQAAELEKLVVDGSGLELHEKVELAGRLYLDYVNSTKELMQSRKVEESRLYIDFQRLQQREGNGHTAQRAIGELMAKHVDLFGTPAEAAATDNAAG